MRKIVAFIITTATVIGVLCGGSVVAFADFGYGAAAVASDVKLIKTGLFGQKICFSDGDFKSALALTDFDTVTVTKLPPSTEGTLLIGGRRVGQGRVIKRKNLGALVFVPASDKVEGSGFKFTVDGYAGGAELECVLKFTDRVNYAPKTDGEDTIKTQSDISVWGSISATDPEGDTLSYMVVTYPKYGSVSMLDGGKYCYTPDRGYTGNDRFTYVVRDEYGNYSEPEVVKLKVTSRMCDTVYVDMTEREEYNAAVALTAMNVMSGRLVGDDVYFMPDDTVSRAEFIAMAMKALGIRADSTLGSTYFDDDGEIPASLKGYVATAVKLGYIDGDFVDGRLLLSPNETITKYEAAKLMATVCGALRDGEEDVFAPREDVPTWARAGVSAMCSLGVIDEGEALSDSVTRATAAEYLYRLMNA